jgi:hypothetical protein
MTVEIHALFPSTAFPIITVAEPCPAPDEYTRRWFSICDHTFDDGRQVRILITWSSCSEFAPTYEPLAELAEDGTPTRFLTGMLTSEMTYRLAQTPEDLAEFTQTATLLNPETNELYQLPFSAMCVSATLNNMVDDLGGLDGTPIPIGANIINGTPANTLRLLQMLQILGNPSFGIEVIKNWSHHDVPEINCEMRSPQLDTILKAAPVLDESPREAEIAAAAGVPQFKFAKGWTDHVSLDYFVTAVDFLDIQPLCMYISHAYASKMSNI